MSSLHPVVLHGLLFFCPGPTLELILKQLKHHPQRPDLGSFRVHSCASDLRLYSTPSSLPVSSAICLFCAQGKGNLHFHFVLSTGKNTYHLQSQESASCQRSNCECRPGFLQDLRTEMQLRWSLAKGYYIGFEARPHWIWTPDYPQGGTQVSFPSLRTSCWYLGCPRLCTPCFKGALPPECLAQVLECTLVGTLGTQAGL